MQQSLHHYTRQVSVGTTEAEAAEGAKEELTSFGIWDSQVNGWYGRISVVTVVL